MLPFESERSLPSAANVVRNIDAVTLKPEVRSTMELATVSLVLGSGRSFWA